MEKQILKITPKIIAIILLLPIIFVFLVQFSGYFQFFIVMSNSNQPSQETGDIVFIDRKIPYNDYKIGDSVLYTPPGFDEVIIHRIYDIQEFNGTKYFAIKGDSNPQPDAVAGISPVINLILTNQTITWSSFYENSSNPTSDIVVSYYPGDLVLHGKVIFKIPTIGWIFVPFNSPIAEPFGILPISLFSLFVLFFIIIAIVSLFSLISMANKELKNLLYFLTISNIKRPVTIQLKNFYQMLFIPFILFSITIFTITPTPYVLNDDLVLESSTFNQNEIDKFWELEYSQIKTLDSLVVTQKNISKITIKYFELDNFVRVNYFETLNATGTSIDPELNYNVNKEINFSLTINKSNGFIISSSNTSYPNLNKFFKYKNYFTLGSKGVMTNNIYIKSHIGSYKNQDVIIGELNYSFVQDLINVEWNVKSIFDKETGFLLYMNIHQIESLWILPEILGMLFICVGIVAFYQFLKRHIQILFDTKQDMIIKSQSSTPQHYEIESRTESDKGNEFLSENLEPKQNSVSEFNLKKKYSWEELQKLEESD